MTLRILKPLNAIASLLTVLTMASNSPLAIDSRAAAASNEGQRLGSIHTQEDGGARNAQVDPALLSPLNSISSGNTSRHLARPTLQYGFTLEDGLLLVGGILNVAACLFNSVLAGVNFAWYPVAALSCSSAISVVKAVATNEAPYKEFADLWTYAREELARTQRLETSHSAEDFLAEMLGPAPREPEIVDAHMSSDVACQERNTVFTNADYAFPSAYVKTANAAADTRVRSDWFAESVDGYGPNSYLASDLLIGEGPEFCLGYDPMNYPTPTGVYRVDIYLNGNYAKSVEFTVEAEPEIIDGNGVFVTDAYMSLDEDGSQRTEDYSEDDTFYANVELAETRYEMEVSLEWYFYDYDRQLIHTSASPPNESGLWTGILAPGMPWPEGTYMVDVFINDEYQTFLVFSVFARTPDIGGGGDDNGQGQTDFDGRYEGQAFLDCPSSYYSGTVTATYVLRGNQITYEERRATADIEINSSGLASWTWSYYLEGNVTEEHSAQFGGGIVRGKVDVYGWDPSGKCTANYTGYRQ